LGDAGEGDAATVSPALKYVKAQAIARTFARRHFSAIGKNALPLEFRMFKVYLAANHGGTPVLRMLCA
jgi:hypothetical protein